jgi:hypothetical protein
MRRKRRPSSDPTTYRIEYSLAVELLHAASKDEAQEAPLPEGAVESLAELSRVVEIARSALSREERGLEHGGEASKQALNLVQASATELSRQGWRYPGRRPPWYVRYRCKRHSRRLAEFLNRVLEPATVVLFWSSLVEEGWPTLEFEASTGPVDRRQLLAALREERSAAAQLLRAYLYEMLDPKHEPLSPWQRLLAHLGAVRLRPRSEPEPRIRYNLACLFSRIASRKSPQAEQELTESARQLSIALAGSHGREREAMARWARRDPGLSHLRRTERFPLPLKGGSI